MYVYLVEKMPALLKMTLEKTDPEISCKMSIFAFFFLI